MGRRYVAGTAAVAVGTVASRVDHLCQHRKTGSMETEITIRVDLRTELYGRKIRASAEGAIFEDDPTYEVVELSCDDTESPICVDGDDPEFDSGAVSWGFEAIKRWRSAKELLREDLEERE